MPIIKFSPSFQSLPARCPASWKAAIGPALHGRRAAADRTLDVVLDHEVEPARRGADHRLPAFDRQMDRPRHQREFLQRVAAIRHLGRQRVVLALVREASRC